MRLLMSPPQAGLALLVAPAFAWMENRGLDNLVAPARVPDGASP